MKVHGAAAHNMEHPAPEVAALESTHSHESATWASPAGDSSRPWNKSMETQSGTLTIRRSGMLRSYKIGSRPFDTFSRGVFLRLARSCRVVEKFDKNHRFFVIFCRSGPEKRSIGSDFSATRQDLGKRRKMPSANVLNFMLASS